MPGVLIFLPIFVALLGGGLAGAIFSWYVNRPSRTIVTYAINTTTLASPGAATIIPNLKLEIGSETIKALYAHAIDLSWAKGQFVDSVEAALTFPHPVRIYGTTANAPTKLHEISCIEHLDGVRCSLGPISQPATYRITLATDEMTPPIVQVVAKNVALRSIAEVREARTWFVGLWSIASATTVFALLLFLFIREMGELSHPIVLGKILTPSGEPVNGAMVEVILDSPEVVEYSPAYTDSDGAFGSFLPRSSWVRSILGVDQPGIVKRLNINDKRPRLSGKLRVTSPGYYPLVTQFHGNIVIGSLTPKPH
jgi:hypothetical protein